MSLLNETNYRMKALRGAEVLQQGFYDVPGEGVLRLGRSADADIVVADKAVSRDHCEVFCTDKAVLVRDLKSKNGTYVNGHRIDSSVLNVGDLLVLGNVGFHLEISPQYASSGLAPSHTRDAEVGVDNSHITRRCKIDDAASEIHHEIGEQANKEAARDLNNLYTTMRKISKFSDPSQMADILLQEIFSFIKAETGCVLVLNEREEFEFLCAYGRGERSPDEKPNISKTILETVLSTGEVILCHDATQDDRFRAGHSIILQNLKSVLCVPLVSEGEVTGVIYLDSRNEIGAFSDREIRLLVAIGQQVGSYIQQARLSRNLEQLFIGTVQSLIAAIEAKDPYTKGHSQRVTFFAVRIAEEMKLSALEIVEVYLAGLFHDIGKIGIREGILNKNERLTEEEFAHIKQHPVYGAEIIRTIRNIDSIIEVVLHHHERYDGSGYPDGLAGERIPLSARILAVADAYDAMTSDRPYRQGMSTETAFEELRKNANVQFDRKVVQHFFTAMERGRMNSDSLGVCLESGQKELYSLWK